MDKETTTVQETVVSHSPNAVTQTRTVTTESFWADFFVSKTNQIIFGLVAILDLLLLLRVMFLFAGANQVGVVATLINITAVFVMPFQGIFPSPSSGTSYLDIAALLAIVMWAVFGLIIGVVLEWFTTDTE